MRNRLRRRERVERQTQDIIRGAKLFNEWFAAPTDKGEERYNKAQRWKAWRVSHKPQDIKAAMTRANQLALDN